MLPLSSPSGTNRASPLAFAYVPSRIMSNHCYGVNRPSDLCGLLSVVFWNTVAIRASRGNFWFLVLGFDRRLARDNPLESRGPGVFGVTKVP